jgi:hypothetical protein
MVSAGDHERMPEREGSQENEYNPTDEERDAVFEKEHLRQIRKGVKLKKKSKVVDNIIGMSMEEYQKSLAQRSGKAPNTGSSEKQPNSAVKQRYSKSNKTLPNRAENRPPRPDAQDVKRPPKPSKGLLMNKPVDMNGDNDMAKVFNLANQGKNGFKMSNKLRNKLFRRK